MAPQISRMKSGSCRRVTNICEARKSSTKPSQQHQCGVLHHAERSGLSTTEGRPGWQAAPRCSACPATRSCRGSAPHGGSSPAPTKFPPRTISAQTAAE